MWINQTYSFSVFEIGFLNRIGLFRIKKELKFTTTRNVIKMYIVSMYFICVCYIDLIGYFQKRVMYTVHYVLFN